MAFHSKPTGYKQKVPEQEILPLLFTPNKARRANDWLQSGKYSYDEKINALKNLWAKEEERQATNKVLKESFKPKMVPRIRIWLNEAQADEKKAVMKLFRSMANDHPLENHSSHPKNACDPSRPTAIASLSTKDSEATKAQSSKSKKVNWETGHPRVKTQGSLLSPKAQLRTEFDIAPDWRAPKRNVVPMTQIARRQGQVQERLPRLSKHVCLNGPNGREFVIHPEWIIR